MKKHLELYEKVKSQMESQMADDGGIEEAARCCANSIMKDRLIHVYGCGHSQMFAMEIFYRAGGLVPVNAILLPHVALSPKAKLSTFQERVEGFSQLALEQYDTHEDDTMMIISISGRNASVIDMALAAKAKGMKVIALTSKAFSDKVTSRHSNGKNLIDVVDVVIDIKCEYGDACLSLPNYKSKFTGTSTILGMLAMDCITSRTIELCYEEHVEPPVFISSNTDGGDEVNLAHLSRYKHMVDGF
ncbi:putative phosphosugar-binding protein [Breznakia sp. PF5-3]|uniref:SIS domain-containing protein n=1 Tax=unclassified Breznakia TaxID=2623764 RepID=UPI002405965F|nr:MULTISPECIES: SIS domain-containing protein [unclassified Breznakia]MDF9824442.1 putative phosphosugar-binding protein [Breznakia sp. PM6-1]MDF9835276.1 putative phosphosugar-binding protein [Breznakia sp. PF5-3]MDF9837397.1 putative phosphosugar-binding protein [Breznakia sp. PFB2-8]MDF9859332.1 putative phosphosugar-binding protein [Breznakia sp. PH5-24]